MVPTAQGRLRPPLLPFEAPAPTLVQISVHMRPSKCNFLAVKEDICTRVLLRPSGWVGPLLGMGRTCSVILTWL